MRNSRYVAVVAFLAFLFVCIVMVGTYIILHAYIPVSNERKTSQVLDTDRMVRGFHSNVIPNVISDGYVSLDVPLTNIRIAKAFRDALVSHNLWNPTEGEPFYNFLVTVKLSRNENNTTHVEIDESMHSIFLLQTYWEGTDTFDMDGSNSSIITSRVRSLAEDFCSQVR